MSYWLMLSRTRFIQRLSYGQRLDHSNFTYNLSRLSILPMAIYLRVLTYLKRKEIRSISEKLDRRIRLDSESSDFGLWPERRACRCIPTTTWASYCQIHRLRLRRRLIDQLYHWQARNCRLLHYLSLKIEH